jgi:hypothetical protein
MELIEWPSVLQPRNINIRPPSQTKSLTKTLTNFEQVQPVIRPPWRVSLSFATLVGDKVLAYRALLAACEGRTNPIRLPIFDLYHWASDAQIGAGEVPHSDTTLFSDLTAYGVIDVSDVVVNGIQGEKQISVDFSQYGPILKAGQYFGIADDLHIATGVWWAGTVATIKFTSSLRRDHVNAPLRLRPYLIARLADDDTGEHGLAYGRWTEPVLELDEVFYEPLS